jgi:hypothetical protein
MNLKINGLERELEMKQKTPDNVVDEPNLMPYPTNVGAPTFVPTNIPIWKGVRASELNTDFKNRYSNIQNELDKLNEDVEINTILYTSNYNFEPKIGEPYHLYLNDDDEPFLSLINEDEWGRKWKPKKYLGTFILDWKNKWSRVKN